MIRIYVIIVNLAMLVACRYEDVADANYPKQKISIAGASLGIIKVSSVSGVKPVRYQFDPAANKLTIPLGVNRSGIDNTGDVLVALKLNVDTVAYLSNQNLLGDAQSLPSDRISFPESVTVNNGTDVAPFSAVIDLGYLGQNLPAKFAFAISVATETRPVSPAFRTIIFIIDTQALLPTANFNAKANAANALEYTFSNTSLNGLHYAWDFGDSSTSTDTSPTHAYGASGTYVVTLQTIGVYGADKSATVTKEIIIP